MFRCDFERKLTLWTFVTTRNAYFTTSNKHKTTTIIVCAMCWTMSRTPMKHAKAGLNGSFLVGLFVELFT